MHCARLGKGQAQSLLMETNAGARDNENKPILPPVTIRPQYDDHGLDRGHVFGSCSPGQKRRARSPSAFAHRRATEQASGPGPRAGHW